MAIKIRANGRFQKLSVIDGTRAYTELRQQVVKAGLLNRSYGYYSLLVMFALAGFLVSTYNIYRITSTPMVMFWGIILSFFAVQLGGLMHDAGHRAIFNSSKINDIFGYFLGLVISKRYSHWRVNHNKHHAHPNQDEEDPDIQIPFSFTEDRYKGAKGFKGFVRRYQAFCYFPLGSLVAFRMRINDLISFKENFNKRSLIELVLYIISFTFWVILPFFFFDFAKAVVVVLVVNYAMGLYLLNVFAPNHKGMTEIEKGVRLSFLEQQIVTSRNIHGHLVTDFMYVGLNYQIEHHLFPNCPRNKLKRLTPFVRKFCRKQKLPFTSVGVFETNKIILSELHAISMSDRKREKQRA